MASEDDSDSSGSDFEDVQVSDQDMSALLDLEQQLEKNPNSYDTHLQVIELLRRNELQTKLRGAREAMQAQFPLTEALWLEWLEDEAAAGSSWSYLQGLHEKAANDYLSVAIWEKYIRSTAQLGDSGETDTGFDDVAEKAIVSAGLHPAEGHRIWNSIREHVIAGLAKQPDDEKLQDKVRQLFHRQLQVPLLAGPNTLAAYQSWAGSEPPAAVMSGYQKAQASAGARRELEAAVAAGKPADMDLLASLSAYIKLEQAQGDPARVQLAYERAIAAFPVTHFLWSQYARYLEQHLGRIPKLVHGVYQRALRNCPWVGSLWAGAIRAAERLGSPQADLEDLYNRALQAGMQTQEDYMEVVLAKIDSARRRVQTPQAMPPLRQAFEAAEGLMQSYFPEFVDPALRMTAYRADCEVRLGKDMKAARDVWEAALKTPASRLVETWAGYIAMEVGEGHLKEARSLYRRCHAKHLQDGGQLSLCQAWQRFEREHGSPEDHLQACLKTEPLLAKAAAEADAQLAASAAEAAARAPKPQLSKAEMNAKRREHDPTFNQVKADKKAAHAASTNAQPPAADNKRKAPGPKAPGNDAPEPSAEPMAEPAAKRAKLTEDPTKPAGGPQRSPQSDAPAPMDVDNSSNTAQEEQRPVHTAFVKHLKESVDEAALRKIFDGCGEIVSLKIGREAETNRSRGFAYVDFVSEEALQKAVDMDDLELEGKHLLIAVSRGRGGRGRGSGRGAPAGRSQVSGRGNANLGRGDFNSGRGSFPGRGQSNMGRGGPPSGRGREQGDRFQDGAGPSMAGGSAERGRGREGRGREGRGRGRAGLGFRPPADESHAQRAPQQLDVDGSKTPATMFKPRAVAAAPSDQRATAPKSNSDFRQMLMGNKK